MGNSKWVRAACVSATALLAAAGQAQAGGFAVREQSSYFMGSAFAGSAAGSDISSMFWNPAAAAALPGFNSSSSYTAVLGQSELHATGGIFLPGKPADADTGTNAVVPASYITYQLSDRLYAGLGMNAPYGLATKPDNKDWAGSPIAITSKVFTLNLNPTLAYKITPEITVGAGVQIEYFKLRLNHGSFDQPIIGAVSPSRSYKADDWGIGATAGVIWQPRAGTSIGLGYRTAVGLDVSGDYHRGAFTHVGPGPTFTPVPGFTVNAAGSITLPDEVTLSIRQAATDRLTLLGTIEWQNWSRVGNVTAKGACPGGAGTCETLNLNYRDGWFYSVGAEYAYNPWLTLRAGIGLERSPIQDSTRDILLPDSGRVHLNAGATYKWSDRMSFNFAYSHIFFDDAPFCMADPHSNGGTSHCTGKPTEVVLLRGSSDNAVDLVSVGMNYKIGGYEALEPLK